MFIRDLLESLGAEKRKQARMKQTQRFAAGVGIAAIAGITTGILIAPKSGKETMDNMKDKANDTVEAIKNFVQQKSDTLKDAATDTAQKVSDAIEDADKKSAGVGKEVKNGYKRFKNDVHKTKQGIIKKLQ